MHLAEDEAQTKVVATETQGTAVLVHVVPFQGTDLALWTGIPLLGVMGFSFSG